MNRRMAKAKAARKFHAARRRRILRRGVTITISFDCNATALAFAMLGNAARQAAAAFADFGRAAARADAIDGECTRVHQGGVVTPRALPFLPDAGPEHVLPAGQLYMGARGGGKRYLGETGPITLQLEPPRDPNMPPYCQGCTCTVFTAWRDTDGGLTSTPYLAKSEPCHACLDLEDRAAGEGFGLVLPEYCGTCGEPIEADDMTGTTCACARKHD